MLHLPSNLQPHVNCHPNAVFTIIAFRFPLVFTFLHHLCPRVNFCKSNFSCSESSADRQRVCKRLLAQTLPPDTISSWYRQHQEDVWSVLSRPQIQQRRQLPLWSPSTRLLSTIGSFRRDLQGTVLFDGSTSDPFNIRSEVKKGCVLATTLFGIFFAFLLKQAFGDATEGIYFQTRSDGKLCNLSRLTAKSKVQMKYPRDLLFADDAAITAHSAEDLQNVMSRFSKAYQDFLKISLTKP